MTHNLDTPAHVYSPAEIDRLADVMTDYMEAKHGERYGQRQAAEANASQIPRMTANVTGNLVLDWATVTYQFVRGNADQTAAKFCLKLMTGERVAA